MEVKDVVEIEKIEEKSSEEKMVEMMTYMRYSEEEKTQWHKLIIDFNALYYKMAVQTWATTRWRGVYILKPPTDMWVYQELINEIKPDLIIETGTLYGGSALFMRDVLDNVYPEGKIISIDIDDTKIQETARKPGIEFYKGSSVADETLIHIKAHIAVYKCERVMVVLDSDHEEEHVSRELELYTPLITIGSILVVEDTGNHSGPLAAISSWSLQQTGFKKNLMGEKYMLTFCRDGFWERIS